MKTLHLIQTISKIAGIVCRVIFVCCIVGFCLCVVGVVSLALGVPTLKLGGVTLESILQTEADMSVGSSILAAAIGAVACAGEGILAKLAAHYFKREQADGTPFTFDGAKELLRLGILTICIPICMQIIAQIVQTILVKTLADTVPQDAEMGGAVAVGAVLIVLSFICKYGAELLTEQNVPQAENAPEE